MYYFAYGSNLNIDEMRLRCPNAKYIGCGVIDGYKLNFRYYLSADKNESHKIYVGIWEIKDADLKALDYYEGYPTLYDRIAVNCTVCLDKTVVNGYLYVMKKGQYAIKRPSSEYFTRCFKGYKQCGISYKQLIDAYEVVI